MSENIRIQQIAAKRDRLAETRKYLSAFLATPGADDVVPLLMELLQVHPLKRETAEDTAYAVGMHDALQEIARIQQQARGNYT